MKKNIKKLPQSKIEMEFEIPVEEWEEFLNEAVKELSNDLRMAGFRSGNIPRNLVEREIGLRKILEKGSELAVRRTYVRTILDEKIEAIGTPQISVLKAAADNPFVFKVEVAVLPEVELPNYTKIAASQKTKDKKEIVVEEKEITQSLEWLQKSRAKLITVTRGAKKGDRVEIDFVVSRDKVKIDKAESKNHPFILGQGRFVPGFEEEIAGMREGEQKEFQLTFPQDYYSKDLAGQKADFKVKMNLVQEQELPEINDNFAKNLGNFESLESLKQSIKEGKTYEKQEQERQRWREKVVEQISGQAKIDLPEILIDQEVASIINELKSTAAQFGLEWKKYLAELKKTEAELIEDSRPQAEKRVKNILVLREIAKQEKIEVSPEEVGEQVEKLLRQYTDVARAKSQVDIERLKEYTYGVIRNEKTFKRLEEISAKS